MIIIFQNLEKEIFNFEKKLSILLTLETMLQFIIKLRWRYLGAWYRKNNKKLKIYFEKKLKKFFF